MSQVFTAPSMRPLFVLLSELQSGMLTTQSSDGEFRDAHDAALPFLDSIRRGYYTGVFLTHRQDHNGEVLVDGRRRAATLLAAFRAKYAYDLVAERFVVSANGCAGSTSVLLSDIRTPVATSQAARSFREHGKTVLGNRVERLRSDFADYVFPVFSLHTNDARVVAAILERMHY